jgi:site-specific recombinase XerD
MSTFKNYLLSKGYSTETTNSYNRGLLQYIVWSETQKIEVEQSTYNEVISYVQYLKNKGLQQRSIQQSVNSLKHYFKWLIKRQLRNDNPTSNVNIKGIKRRKLHNVLNKQELEKLYNDFKNIETESLAKKRNEIIVSLLVYQGLNSKELGRLKVTDLKLREGKIYIERTRNSNERHLKLEAHQILDIMEYQLRTREEILKVAKKQTDLLFMSFGKSAKFHNVIHKLLPQLKRLNRNIKSVNQIRTSVITAWLKSYNLREVQYMSGHRYVSSTEAYLVNDLEDLQEDINKYHPIN